MKQAPPTGSQPPPASAPALAPPNGLSSTPRLSFEAQIKRQPAPTAPPRHLLFSLCQQIVCGC